MQAGGDSMAIRSGLKQTLLVCAGAGLLLFNVTASAVGTGLLWKVDALQMDIRFLPYVEAGFPEQDVFVEPGDLPDPASAGDASSARPRKPHTDPLTGRIISDPGWVADVVRVEPAEALRPVYLAKMLYATSKVTPHDPYQLEPQSLGPFPKGDELGFSLQEWLAASGSGAYIVDGSLAELRLALEKLVPRGTYRLWCARVTRPPHYASSEKPCGALDGSQNKFQADAKGNAVFNLRMKTLPETTTETATVLQLNYTREVITQDGDLGGYGLNEHVQLHATLPLRAPATQVNDARLSANP